MASSLSLPDVLDQGTLNALEWPRLLTALSDRLSTGYGQERLEAMAPMTKLGAIRHSLGQIGQMRKIRAESGALKFDGIQPLLPYLERAGRQGVLEAEALAAVLSTQRCALRLAADLSTLPDVPGLAMLAGDLVPLRELVERLGAALLPSGGFNESAFPEVARQRGLVTGKRERIHRKLEAFLRDPKLAPVFQDTVFTVRGRRYVLPVKADFKGHLTGIVHDVSASGATLYIEPRELVEETNALAVAEKALELEIEKILRELSASVGASSMELRANLDWIGEVDLIHAQAILSEDYQGSAPTVEQEGVISLKGVAHPLMLLEAAAQKQSSRKDGLAGPTSENRLPGKIDTAAANTVTANTVAGNIIVRDKVVRNDISLGETTRCMVISGANTGGKTVMLKTTGLCALLAVHGMHVPAHPGSRVDRFGAIRADIGDRQSLAASLSTFSAQIENLARWLPLVGPDTLMLLDELLTGTEPAQGAALGEAVLEWMVKKGATTLITTHFVELKELAARHGGITNASMAFDPARLRPTFRLQVGLPGASYAMHIARYHGLPGALVSRAERALGERPVAMDAMLVKYQAAQVALDRAEEALGRRESRLNSSQEALGREKNELESRERSLRRKEHGAVGRELRNVRKRIADVIRTLQQANSLPMAGKAREQLATLEQDVERRAPPPEPRPREKLAPTMAPGAQVWLTGLEQPGVVETVLDGGAKARVLLGAVTMEVPREDLEGLPPKEARRGGASRKERGGKSGEGNESRVTSGVIHGGAKVHPEDRQSGIPFAFSTEDNTLDLRGLRLESALEAAERFMDLCTVKHVSPLLIIHGHGTGRLKLGLRERLAESPYVSAFRPGERGEGGDGATVVALNL